MSDTKLVNIVKHWQQAVDDMRLLNKQVEEAEESIRLFIERDVKHQLKKTLPKTRFYLEIINSKYTNDNTYTIYIYYNTKNKYNLSSKNYTKLKTLYNIMEDHYKSVLEPLNCNIKIQII